MPPCRSLPIICLTTLLTMPLFTPFTLFIIMNLTCTPNQLPITQLQHLTTLPLLLTTQLPLLTTQLPLPITQLLLLTMNPICIMLITQPHTLLTQLPMPHTTQLLTLLPFTTLLMLPPLLIMNITFTTINTLIITR